MPELLIALLVAYIIGSIPFGLLLTKAAGLGDIRTLGSGNIGATNVLRTGNKKLALLTLLLDGGKGWLAVFTAQQLLSAAGNNADHLTGWALLAATVGHIFPLWLKFKGGKGVATALGGSLAFYPALGLICLLLWLLVFTLTRVSSLSALTALWGSLPLTFAYMTSRTPDMAPFFFYLVALPMLPLNLLITCRHRDNIRRLLNGTEPKSGVKK